MLGNDQFYQIGQVLKSNGTDGQVVISLSAADAEDISEKEPVYIFFDELPVPYFISKPVRRGSNKILCYLTDTRTLEDAEELCGRGIYLRDEDCGGDDDMNLTGWTVNGVATVVDIEDIPGNPCLVVRVDKSTAFNMKGQEVLIPLHEDLISQMDEAQKTLRMDLPEGLL